MAIAWVASTGGYGTVAGSTTSIATASGVAVTAGNAIVVGVQNVSTAAYKTVTGITDTAGNTYALCGSRYQYLLSGTYYVNTEMWVAANIAGHASNVVTASYSTANAAALIIAGSYSGMATSSPYDTAYDPGGNLDTTSPYTNASDSTTEDAEMIVCMYFSIVGSTQTFSSSAPSTFRFSSTQGRAIADNLTTAAGAYTVSVASTVSEATICLAKAFKQAAAAAASIVPLLLYQYRARRQ